MRRATIVSALLLGAASTLAGQLEVELRSDGSSGLTLGGDLYAAPGGWRIQGFAGRFISTDESAVDYTYAETLGYLRKIDANWRRLSADATRVRGRR